MKNKKKQGKVCITPKSVVPTASQHNQDSQYIVRKKRGSGMFGQVGGGYGAR